MFLYLRSFATRLPARARWAVLLAIAALAGAYQARAQSAGIAGLRAQIERYGCNLPQYANSVAGCRRLHARLRALQSGTSGYSGYYASPRPYSGGSYATRRTARPSPPSDPISGFFGTLFGGSSAQNRPSGRYDTYNMSRAYDSEWRSGRWTGTYPSYMRGGGRYRTLCVRTCDGYYWPVSFSTTAAGFARDARQCTSSCSAPARLFVHRNPGADVEHMTDLQGTPYSQLENAFRYREKYVANCRCNPEPWSEAAQQEYERRAAEAENPGAATMAANETGAEQGTASSPVQPAAGYSPRPQASRRPRFRSQDTQFEGQWWGGSW